jgi:hypothetical protein
MSNLIQNAIEKSGDVSRKLEKIGQNVSQTFVPKPKFDRMWTWWVLNILLKTILVYGVNILNWNLEVEPFVAQWIV